MIVHWTFAFILCVLISHVITDIHSHILSSFTIVDMVDIAVLGLCLCLACLVSLFILGLWTSQHLNCARIFYSTSIVCCLLALYMPIYLKYHSPWPIDNTSMAAEFSAGMGFLLALKFFVLAFGEDWTFARKMTSKQIVVECFAFPLAVESSAEKSFEHAVDARHESIYTILRGLGEVVILRVYVRCMPRVWFSLPVSSFLPFLWSVRCAVLGVTLYLTLSMSMDLMLGLTGLLFNVRMDSPFPSIPFTSTSLRAFWSQRWDIPVKRVLHRMCFVVIPRLTGAVTTMNKTARAFLDFALSGLLHEFVLKMISDRWSGKNMLFFMLQAMLISIEIAIKLPAKTTTSIGKFAGWTWTMCALVLTSPLFFDPWIEAGYYARIKESLG